MSEQETAMKAFVVSFLIDRARRLGFDSLEVDGDFDFFESGLLDSFGLIELIDSVESSFNLQLDFTDMDPDAFTTVHGLVKSLMSAEP
ncbi:MAG: phosphopantetheine-binding protein [Actinomycetota bacterium]|jgi:D-alanine--poly(phosphoribitol) ligase subunit 2